MFRELAFGFVQNAVQITENLGVAGSSSVFDVAMQSPVGFATDFELGGATEALSALARDEIFQSATLVNLHQGALGEVVGDGVHVAKIILDEVEIIFDNRRNEETHGTGSFQGHFVVNRPVALGLGQLGERADVVYGVNFAEIFRAGARCEEGKTAPLFVANVGAVENLLHGAGGLKEPGQQLLIEEVRAFRNFQGVVLQEADQVVPLTEVHGVFHGGTRGENGDEISRVFLGQFRAGHVLDSRVSVADATLENVEPFVVEGLFVGA